MGEGIREYFAWKKPLLPETLNPKPHDPIVPLKYIEYGSGYIIIRSPYTPHSIYLRGTISPKPRTLISKL